MKSVYRSRASWFERRNSIWTQGDSEDLDVEGEFERSGGVGRLERLATWQNLNPPSVICLTERVFTLLVMVGQAQSGGEPISSLGTEKTEKSTRNILPIALSQTKYEPTRTNL